MGCAILKVLMLLISVMLVVVIVVVVMVMMMMVVAVVMMTAVSLALDGRRYHGSNSRLAYGLCQEIGSCP